MNSYFDNSSESTVEIGHENSKGFGETYKLREGNGPRFDTLLEKYHKISTLNLGVLKLRLKLDLDLHLHIQRTFLKEFSRL